MEENDNMSAELGGNAPATSPIERAKDNINSVVMRRLTGELDEEQAQQALEALNGTKREG